MIRYLNAPYPSRGLQRKVQPRNLGSQFGDGFSSSTPDGIFTMLMELSPNWKLLSFEEGDGMDAFFREAHGHTFYWKLPRETTPRAWRCPEWTLVEEGTTAEISANFVEQPPTDAAVGLANVYAELITEAEDTGIISRPQQSLYAEQSISLNFVANTYRNGLVRS